MAVSFGPSGPILAVVSIHLDHAATTPLRPEIAELIASVGALGLGNPSALHAAGRRARRMLDDARDEVADVLGADSDEIVFTSGGTEANDLAVNGVAERRPGVVLCSAVEHDSVLEPVRALDGRVVAVDDRGRLSLDALGGTLTRERDADGVALVSVMLVNNENGVRQPLDEAAALTRELAPGTPVHTDAVQAAAWLDLAVHAASADLVTVTAHKLGGPVGTGALVVRSGTSVAARLRGGGQENERRSGTQNVVGAIAFARALSLAAAERDDAAARAASLRDRFVEGITVGVDAVVEPARPERDDRAGLVGGTVQVCFPGLESEALLFLLDDAGVEASAGSACAAGALEPSHVLAAMGVPAPVARGALRISVGRDTTPDDIDRAVEIVTGVVTRLAKGQAA